MATAVSQVCDSGILNDIDPANITNCETCSAALKSLMKPMEDLFEECSHLNLEYNCDHMFKVVVTEGGVCFTYNNVEVFRNLEGTDDEIVETWTLEGGYANHTGNIDIHPRAGGKGGISVYARVPEMLVDGVCKGAKQGLTVYLNLPNEVPQIAKHSYRIPVHTNTIIGINPRVTTTMPELRSFPVAKRQCYFSDERYLRFFRHYTQNNCEIECLVNLTLVRCGCLKFHMPRIPGTRFCSTGDIKCTQSVIQEHAVDSINENRYSGCRCLTTCTAITYDTEINHSFYPHEFQIAEIEIGFRATQFFALKRSQLFGKTELIANCGGLLGLFLGFSFISILELIYFMTIRLICSVIRNRHL